MPQGQEAALLEGGSPVLGTFRYSLLLILIGGFLIGGFLADARAAPDKRVALVIGNASYAHITALNKPSHDARKMADILRSMQFDVIFATDATKSQLEDLAQKFRAGLKGADVGFFFYSGHGFQTNRANQQHPVNHIVPVDFKVDDENSLPATLPLDVIIDALKREARVGFVFMDACRSDPQLTAASERLASGTRAVTIARGFSPINVASDRQPAARQKSAKGPAGLLIAYATDPGNVAFEGDKGQFSPFTASLVKHLVTPGLSAAEIMGRVSAEVSTETLGQQTPWNVSSLTAGTYRFVAAPPAPLASPTSATKSGAAPARNGSNLPPNVGVGVGGGL
jgi:uncharacterized caspase-like protein